MGYNSALMNFISPYTFSRSFPFARYVRKNDTFSFGGYLGVQWCFWGFLGDVLSFWGFLGGPSSFGGFLGVVVTLICLKSLFFEFLKNLLFFVRDGC